MGENKDLKVLDLLLSKINDNPYQPRQRYPKTEIKRLAKNINDRGLLHPICVVQLKDKENYVIVSGHRRTRAFRMLRKKTVPAIIRKQSSQKDLALDLAIENALRKDFNPAEKAQSIFQVMSTIPNVQNDVLRAYSLITQVKLYNKGRKIEQFKHQKGNTKGLTDDDMFKCIRLLNLLDISENTALKYLRLLGLPKFIQEKIVSISSNESISKRMISEGYITVTMGYEISRIKEDSIRTKLYHKAIGENWNAITLRHVVDEMLEHEEATQINTLGTSKRRGEEDYGMERLAKRCFFLSSALWNFRKKLPIIKLTLNKIVFRASLVKLKKAAQRLSNEISDLLEEELSVEEILSEEIDVKLSKTTDGRKTVRFTFPTKKTEALGLKPNQRLRLKIIGIVK